MMIKTSRLYAERRPQFSTLGKLFAYACASVTKQYELTTTHQQTWLFSAT